MEVGRDLAHGGLRAEFCDEAVTERQHLGVVAAILALQQPEKWCLAHQSGLSSLRFDQGRDAAAECCELILLDAPAAIARSWIVDRSDQLRMLDGMQIIPRLVEHANPVPTHHRVAQAIERIWRAAF